jgi:hypothetical protein
MVLHLSCPDLTHQVKSISSTSPNDACSVHIIKCRLHSPHYQVRTASPHYQVRTSQSTLPSTDCTVDTTKYGLHSQHYQVRTAQSTPPSQGCDIHNQYSLRHQNHRTPNLLWGITDFVASKLAIRTLY